MVGLGSVLVVLAVVSAVAGVALAAVAVRQREASGAVAYAALMLVLATWSALYAMQLREPSVAGKRPWLVARHAIAPAVPVSFWTFAGRYTDRDHLLSSRYLGPLVGVGLVLATMPVVNPAGLYWGDLALASIGSLPVLDVTYGPLFWVMLSGIVVVVGTGHALVVGMLVDSFAVYRRQLTAVAVTGFIGFGLLALYLTDHVQAVPSVNPFPNVQLLSYATVLVMVPLGWSYYRDALFSVQPLAHRTVVGNMDDAVFVLDTDGVVRTANGPALDLVGRSDPGDVSGSTVEAVFANRPALLEAYEGRVAEEGTSSADEAVELDVAGAGRYYDVRYSPIEDASGDPIGRVLVVRDVSERARRREQLERKNEQLERLADVVAHDMRTPLSTARTLLSLLEDDLSNPDPAVRQSVADLDDVHDQLQSFADHLPRLARESTDVESPVACDLAAVAESAWTSVGSDAVELRVEDTRTVQADPRRLQQAFENLFRNAAEHGSSRPSSTADGTGPTDSTGLTDSTGPTGRMDPDGGGSGNGTDRGALTEPLETTDHAGSDAPRSAKTVVRVGTIGEDAGSGSSDGPGQSSRVRGFYVEDDGPGIRPELREDVFEYGMGTGDGSGFGLAIVRIIVEAHGWSIRVTDGTDGGARFEVRTND